MSSRERRACFQTAPARRFDMFGAVHMVLALGSIAGCHDRATIGAVCPVGCVARPADSICDCESAQPVLDAGPCEGADCPGDAGPGQALDACVGAACEDAAAVSGEPTCTQDSYALTRGRLDLMVVFDHGASISPWYAALAEGFRAFLREDASRGVGVGLQLFGDSCDVRTYLPPAQAIAPLPDNLDALERAIPVDATLTDSTLPAYNAAVQYSQRWSTDHPEARVAVLLITDGSPGACDALSGSFDTEAARVALAASASSPPITTYVVATGALQTPDEIARAAGTEVRRVPITATGDDVLMALRSVRGAARGSCELALPDAVSLAPDSKLIVTSASGSETYEIARGGAQPCEQADFYVSDPSEGLPVVACPERCAALDEAQNIELSGACVR
jgi:hypothetical protein